MTNRRLHRRWAKLALWNKISMVGALSSILGIVLSILFAVWQPPASRDIDRKIEELDQIKSALTALRTYVDTQQARLKDLSTQKVELEEERDRIQKVLQIDREKLDALLAYQAAQESRRTWIQIIISFFVGVLSSSAVTFAAMAIKGRAKSQVNSDKEAEQVAPGDK